MFDYFYGSEGEQYSFLILPKSLIKDERFERLSASAIILYCLFLERNALSQKNGWFDEENRAYIIYTRDQIMEDMNCSAPTAAKIVDELAKFGLITKVRRGLGKPDIIYVKNFNKVLVDEENIDSQEVKDIDLQKLNNFTSGRKGTLLLEEKKLYPNNTNNNKLNKNNTDYNNQSFSSGQRPPSSEDEEEYLKNRIGYYEALGLYSPVIVNCVFYDLKRRNIGLLRVMSKEVFLAICRNISDYGGAANNLPAYVTKCVDNMIMAMSVSANTDSESKKYKKTTDSWENRELKQEYEMRSMEKWLLSN